MEGPVPKLPPEQTHDLLISSCVLSPLVIKRAAWLQLQFALIHSSEGEGRGRSRSRPTCRPSFPPAPSFIRAHHRFNQAHTGAGRAQLPGRDPAMSSWGARRLSVLLVQPCSVQVSSWGCTAVLSFPEKTSPQSGPSLVSVSIKLDRDLIHGHSSVPLLF